MRTASAKNLSARDASPPRDLPTWTDATWAWAQTLRKEGMSYTQIAEACGISYGQVKYKFRKRILAPRKAIRHRELDVQIDPARTARIAGEQLRRLQAERARNEP